MRRDVVGKPSADNSDVAATPSPDGSRPRAFVPTRYQGSKQRFLPWLGEIFSGLPFSSATDVFGGTGAVGYLLKTLGKQVHVNDVLLANATNATALVENDAVTLSKERIDRIVAPDRRRRYADVIARTYGGVFYLDAENAWLDVVVQNIHALPDRLERALALHGLFQACLMKRPFNLFHRKNLSVRTARVPRSFGNATTWERPFEELLRASIARANAAVFDNGARHRVTCLDAFACPLDADVVYLDPPYVRADGAAFSYADGYHFLEGLCDYAGWPARVGRSKKHLPYARERSPLEVPRTHKEALLSLLERVGRGSFVVVSYRSDGAVSAADFTAALEKMGRSVRVHEKTSSFALSRARTAELVVVGSPCAGPRSRLTRRP